MFFPGNQIVYIPTHAKGDIKHKDVEYGFVTSATSRDSTFCRFWSNRNSNELRTVSCSELTPVSCLQRHMTKDQKVVDKLLKELY